MRFNNSTVLDKNWSAITLGCWQIAPSGGWGDVCSLEEADRVVKTALDIGITAFDTAEGYGEGESERRLGKALANKIDDVVIISKIWPDAELTHSAFQERLDGTLKALGRDYVDIYLIHWPGQFFDTQEKNEKLAEIMFRLKASGKVKAIGLSNFRAPDLKLLGEGLMRFAVNQVPYSLLERDFEGEARDLCEQSDVPFMAYSPTAVGFLAREMSSDDKNFPARAHEAFFHEPQLKHSIKVFQATRQIADEVGHKPIHVALAWVLAQRNILTAIVGSRKHEQVRDLEIAGDIQLSEEQLSRLTQASDTFMAQVARL